MEQRHNQNKGFSLTEILVAMAIMAVLGAFLIPTFLNQAEKSKMAKDEDAMQNVVEAIDLALAKDEAFDEVEYYSVKNNVSCYIDSSDEGVISAEKTLLPFDDNNPDSYDYQKENRIVDGEPYYAAGNTSGLTLTFIPQDGKYVLSNAIINKYARKDDISQYAGEVRIAGGRTAASAASSDTWEPREIDYANEGQIFQTMHIDGETDGELFSLVQKNVGKGIPISSRTYKNSEFTVFIRIGEDGASVEGQFNGTNLDKQDYQEFPDQAGKVPTPEKPTDPVEPEDNHKHEWGEPEYTWYNNDTKVIATRVCKGDETHRERAITTDITASGVVEATCTTPGTKQLSAHFKEDWANIPGAKKEIKTEALGHDWRTKWDHDQNNHWIECDRCHEKKEIAAHEWTEFEVSVDPIGQNGVSKRTCKICGREELKDMDQVKWKDPEYKWSKNENGDVICTATIESVDGKYKDSETVIADPEVLEDPTCKKEGKIEYTADFESEWAETQKKVDTLPKKDHQWSDEWITGPRDPDHHWHECEDKDCDERKDIVDHTWDAGKVTKEAECEVSGIMTYTCTGCGKTRTEEIKPLGHDWNEVTYKWDDAQGCVATRICKRDASHVQNSEAVSIDERVKDEPTCVKPGVKIQTAKFRDDWAKPVEREVEIPALGHDLVMKHNETKHWQECTRCGEHFDEGDHTWNNGTVNKQPTCTQTGEKTHTCDVCGATKTTVVDKIPHRFSEEWKTDDGQHWHECIYNCGEKSQVGTHTWVKIENGKVDPTCTKPGKQPLECSICKKVVVEDVAPIDHNWGEPKYEWNKDHTECIAKRECAKRECKAVDKSTGTVKSEVIRQPECEVKGVTRYVAEFNESWAKTQTKDVDDIPATGHKWTVRYEWSDDLKTCSAYRDCGNNSAHNIGPVTVAVRTEVAKKSDCTAFGTTKYIAEFDVDWAETQNKFLEDIPATGHDWQVTYQWSEDGKSCSAIRVCKNNSNHKETADGRITPSVHKKPGCLTNGDTLYKATFTEQWAEPQTKIVVGDIAPTGHKWDVKYFWSQDGKTCEAVSTCMNDSSHVKKANGTVTSELLVRENCVDRGIHRYTATFTPSWAKTQTKDVTDIPARSEWQKLKDIPREYHKSINDKTGSKEEWDHDLYHHWHHCSGCDLVMDKAEHDWGPEQADGYVYCQTCSAYKCPDCGGQGEEEVPKVPCCNGGFTIPCDRCGGDGYLDTNNVITGSYIKNGKWYPIKGPDPCWLCGRTGRLWRTCTNCWGTGYTGGGTKTCSHCGGNGWG